jgi:hypothetical protein
LLGKLAQEVAMLKMMAAGFTALFLIAPPCVYAQEAAGGQDASGIQERMRERISAADLGELTDARITIVKAALQLTSDQEKYWPAVEDAIRARAKDREARLASAKARAAELRSEGLLESLRDRDPVAFMHRRAEALAHRSADLKNLADAWQPLYQSLAPEQKRRLALLTILVMGELRTSAEHRRIRRAESEDSDED